LPIKDGTKRKHVSGSTTTDEYLKKKIIKCLEVTETGADSFGKHIAEVLKLFTPVNQELVKARLQYVISESLQRQELKQCIPTVFLE